MNNTPKESIILKNSDGTNRQLVESLYNTKIDYKNDMNSNPYVDFKKDMNSNPYANFQSNNAGQEFKEGKESMDDFINKFNDIDLKKK